MIRATGAASGSRYARMVESRQQFPDLPFLTTKSEAQMAWQALRAMAEQIRVRKTLQKFGRDVVTESRQAYRFFVQPFSRNFGCCAESYNARDVLGCRAKAALLSAAEDDGRELHTLSDVKRSYAFRTMQLVRRERKQINLQTIHIQRNLSAGLHRVGVKQHSVKLGEVGQFLDRLNRSDDVVCSHHGD